MISYLEGKPYVGASNVTVVVHGVGYDVIVSDRDHERIEREGREEVELFVRTVAKENAISLYGFLDINDRLAFDRLQLADGVGPGTALRILSVHGYLDLAAYCANGTRADEGVAFLRKVPGIGAKTAQKIVEQVKL